MSPSYPSSVLAAAERTFALITQEPTSLWLYSSGMDGLPPGRILLPALRQRLLDPATPLSTRDAVWRELIERARRERQAWVVAAVGMAMPGLRRWQRTLTVNGRVDRADVEASLVEGFLAALYRIDVTDRGLCARLVRAAGRAGTRLVYAEAAAEGPAWSLLEAQAPVPPFGHPELLLVDAVAVGVLSQADAALIATTRLEDVPVDEVAAVLGQKTNTVVVRRRRAERRLAEAIADGRVCSGRIGRRRGELAGWEPVSSCGRRSAGVGVIGAALVGHSGVRDRSRGSRSAGTR